MKPLLLITSFVFAFATANSQGAWTQKANFGGAIRYAATGFSIGAKAYIVSGYNNSNDMNDMWEWDQATNTWTQKAAISGARRAAVGFAINGKGYVGLGAYGSSSKYADLWEYDPSANVWVQKANFPSTARYGSGSFVINNKAYVCGGNSGSSTGPFHNELYEYDPIVNGWTQRASFPGIARYAGIGLAASGYGYWGLGYNGTFVKDFWRYDAANNTWSQKANYLGNAGSYPSGFELNGKLYVGCGQMNGIAYKDFWEYNAVADTWNQRADYGGGNRWLAVGFSVSGKGYFGTGSDFTNLYSDFWEYNDCTPPPFTMSHTDVTTNGGLDGSATVTVTGGIPPFTYVWNTFPVQTTTTISNLSAGNYFVTVIDGVGCSGTGNTIVSQPQVLTATVTPVNVSCYGSNDGTATAAVSGGTPPYTYSWNTVPVQTTQTASGLFPGTYTLTASDVIGGICTKTVTVTQPTALQAQTAIVKANCGVSDGKITGSASGGTGPYSYLWSNGATTQAISNIAAGNYSLTVTDSKGCTATDSAMVGAIPANFNIAFTANPQAGTAPLAVAFANATPSLANYDFTWNWGDGGDSVNYNNATAFHIYQYNGYYDVSLIATAKTSGCTDTLLKPQYIYAFGGVSCTHTVAISPVGPLTQCQGDTVVLTASTNAASPFTYQWNVNSVAISGAHDSTLTVTQSGYYSVTAVLGNCPKTSSAVQVNFTTSPAKPVISSAGAIVPCVGGSQTLTSSSISGGTYLWSTGETTQSIEVTASGSYWVSTINSSGCSSVSAPFTVNASLAQIAICMVTVDSSSTQNVIVWEKPQSNSIDSFKIYREIASAYTHIASVSYNSLSTFTDNTNGINPQTTSYKYGISVLDICGNESPMSNHHRTIHLAVSPASPCGYNLFWNDYTGFTVPQYRILRDSAHTGWEVVDSVSFGNTSWTDGNCYPAGDTIEYIVEVVHPTGCSPSIKNPVPMQTIAATRSNSFEVNPAVTFVPDQSGNVFVKIYPNPSQGRFVFTTAAKDISRVEIFNMMGEKVYSSSAVRSNEIDLSSQPDGIYFISLKSQHEIITQKIVIAR